jgi:mevalonate kinase
MEARVATARNLRVKKYGTLSLTASVHVNYFGRVMPIQTEKFAIPFEQLLAAAEHHASAPAKLIVCGEHAVVYGQPAIAVALSDVRARTALVRGEPGSGLQIVAHDLSKLWSRQTEPENPLLKLVENTLDLLEVSNRDLTISFSSQIPIASGMGSGAAIATALVRVVAAYAGHTFSPAEVSALVYASEQSFHGTPSGIDNTVVAYEQPIWYQRPPALADGTRPAASIDSLTISQPFSILIGDTGVRSATHRPVGAVRERWQKNPERYNQLFAEVGAIASQIRDCLTTGDQSALGPLLNANQKLLVRIGVSSPKLNLLVRAARRAGALGAKLSGAGWGGVMFALVTPDSRDAVRQALLDAGATRVLETLVGAPS